MKQFTLKSLMLLLLLLIGGGSYAWGEEITFTAPEGWNKASSSTGDPQSFTKGGVTISTEKGSGNDQYRIYKSGTFTVSSTVGNITKIEITCTASGDAQYGPGSFESIEGYSYSGQIGTWTGSATSVRLTAAKAQVRATNIVVTVESAPAANLTKIEVSGTPTKITYFDGELFDPAGLVVTATYEDESTEVVTSRVKWTFDPATLTLGTNEVKATATYGEMTASKTVTVTVTEAPKVVGIDLTKDNTTTANENKLEWLGEIVTVTANKADATTNANNYYPGNGKTSTRFYRNSTLTFTPAPFVVLGEITYEATTPNFANAMVNSTWTNATAKADGMIVTITPTDGSKPVYAKIYKDENTGGNSFSINYSLANETSLTLAAKSDEGSYYATFSSASACEFAGADVFTVNVEGEKIVLTEVANKQVPANTGVLLKSAQNIVTATRLESVPAIEGTNLLKPASEQMTEGFKYYKLAYDNFTEKTGLGFYWGAADGAAFTVKPGLAYLAVPNAQAANVKGFSFDGTQTGINGVEATAAKGAIYNLNGQRVEKAQRGIYIQNGKKFIVK